MAIGEVDALKIRIGQLERQLSDPEVESGVWERLARETADAMTVLYEIRAVASPRSDPIEASRRVMLD